MTMMKKKKLAMENYSRRMYAWSKNCQISQYFNILEHYDYMSEEYIMSNHVSKFEHKFQNISLYELGKNPDLFNFLDTISYMINGQIKEYNYQNYLKLISFEGEDEHDEDEDDQDEHDKDPYDIGNGGDATNNDNTPASSPVCVIDAGKNDFETQTNAGKDPLSLLKKPTMIKLDRDCRPSNNKYNKNSQTAIWLVDHSSNKNNDENFENCDFF